jgi:hypothetical protein
VWPELIADVRSATRKLSGFDGEVVLSKGWRGWGRPNALGLRRRKKIWQECPVLPGAQVLLILKTYCEELLW